MSASKSDTQKKPAVDWRQIHGKLDAAREALEHALAPDPAEVGRILQARARVLAREPEAAQTAETIECVEFTMAHETYAIESAFIREIHPLTNLTPLPGVPAFVLGIVNIRGEILSVLDLRKFFDLPERGLADLSKVIVLESATMHFGVLADVVVGVRQFPVAGMQRSLPTLTGIRDKYLKGVTAARTVILDAEALLSDDAIIVRAPVER